jgi:hypothetical protein
MALVDNIKIELDDFQRHRLQLIDDFDYSKVKWKVSDDLSGLPDTYLRQGIENLKLYYAVALLDPLNAHAVSAPVDPFWHAHVLFSKDYISFCNQTYGGYVHHQPLDQNDRDAVAMVRRLYTYTIEIYRQMFHSYDTDWWGDTGEIRALRLVCLHMLIKEPELMQRARFPRNPAMQVR